VAREFDLLGDPIPEGRGDPGRTGHIATAENVNKVRLLVAAKWTAQQIAEELGISVPTLNKHYFRNGSIKKAKLVVLSEARGRLMLQLNAAAEAGNVAAMKELSKLIDRVELEEIEKTFTGSKKTAKAKPLGKKEQAQREAFAPDENWEFLPSGQGPDRMQ
jgi:hypothetical protein